MQRRWAVVPMLLGAVAACQPAGETPEQAAARMETETAAARAAIDSTVREFMTHFNAGHADVVAAQFYAADAVVMAPNAPAASGRDAIQAALGAFMPMKPQLTLTTLSVEASGSLAVERGTYSMTFTPPGAPGPVTEAGKYLAHWKQLDGKWVMVADIWNSDQPAPGAPPG